MRMRLPSYVHLTPSTPTWRLSTHGRCCGWRCRATERHRTHTTPAPSRYIHQSPLTVSQYKEQKHLSNAQSPKDNIAVRLIVQGATEILRFLGVGSSPSSTTTAPAVSRDDTSGEAKHNDGVTSTPPPTGDIDAVIAAIKSDYNDRSYFITGVLTDGIYDPECFFGDPTISFTGRELWKSNLALLTPFLINPRIELLDNQVYRINIDERGSENTGETVVVLRADWILETSLRLPWQPYIFVHGSTEYTLAFPDNNRIVKHVESWDISGFEAVLMVLGVLPSKRPRQQQQEYE